MEKIEESIKLQIWDWFVSTYHRMEEDEAYKYLIKAVNSIQVDNGTNLANEAGEKFVFNFPNHDAELLGKVIHKIKELKTDWSSI